MAESRNKLSIYAESEYEYECEILAKSVTN